MIGLLRGSQGPSKCDSCLNSIATPVPIRGSSQFPLQMAPRVASQFPSQMATPVASQFLSQPLQSSPYFARPLQFHPEYRRM